MKTLREITEDIQIIEVIGDIDIPISGISYDTRGKIEAKGCFVAMKGATFDGHTYIHDVVARGAHAIVCEHIEDPKEGITYIKVGNTYDAIAKMSEAYFDYPSRKLKLVGVTGTNGKTTTATLLYSFFRERGENVVLLSTVENKINDDVLPASQTTPDPYDISRMLRDGVDQGAKYAFMEVSSHSIDQRRISGLYFTGGIFTNITHDHLDYHKTFEEYSRVKKQFFDDLPVSAFAISNRDDKQGEWMLKNSRAKKYLYSLNDEADFKGEIFQSTLEGIQMNINNSPLHVPLIGAFNAYNILGVYGALVLLDIPEDEVRNGLSNLKPPKGRLEFVKSPDGIFGVVDYAHTPDALENVLKTIQGIVSKDSQIISVVGCGGDRDPFKRPIMGDIAHEFSTHTIFTSDNPRSEQPEMILEQITERLPDDGTWDVVVDRREAIERAVAMAKSGDIVLVAGKGHEDYQEVKGVKHHFSDQEELKRIFGLSAQAGI